MKNLLLMFVNSSKVAGWARAGVGAGIAAAIAKWPWLSQYVDPTTQAAIATAISGVAVGIWQHIAKNLAPPAAPSIDSQSGGKK